MPVLTITLIEGAYDEDTRERLSRRLTDAVRATIDAPADAITVICNEVPAANYMRGGVRRTPGPPRPAAATVVRGFLAAMEARDLDRAGTFLGEGFSMTFPGGVRFTRLGELVDWAATRYAGIAKTFEGMEEFPGEDGAVVVYCFGTLSGTWPDGTPFAGVRFIDRFTVRDGRIVDQRVWNDLGEARASSAAG